MRLTNWQVKNYKSISEGEFEASPLTVLIGRNNSGKSNVVDSLSDFSSIFNGINETETWFERRVSGKDTSETFELKLEFHLSQLEREAVFSELSEDRVERAENNEFLTDIQVQIDVSDYRNFDREIQFNWRGEFVPLDNSSGSSDSGNPSRKVRSLITKSVDSWKSISAFRVPDNTGRAEYTSAELAADGNNLVQKLFSLEKTEREYIFNQVCESYIEIMDGVSGVDTKLAINRRDDELTVEITEDAFDTGFNFDEISAGSKEILTLLTQIHLAQEDTDLLAIEEPELHLHPEAERKVLAKIQNLVKEHDTQVIVATHSDVFVDEIEAGNIVRVEREGNTTIRTVDQVDLGAELADLGYSKSGLLQSEAVVFVEGLSDTLILSQWADTLGPSFGEDGISIIEVGDKGKIGTHGRSLVKLLCEFDIPYLFVIDSDNSEPRDAIIEQKQKINREDEDGNTDNDNIWWHTTPDHFRAWTDSDIEHFFVERPPVIADVLGSDVAEVEEIIDGSDSNKNAEILDEVWKKCDTEPHDTPSYQKDVDGKRLAQAMDKEQIHDEVKDVIADIRDLA